METAYIDQLRIEYMYSSMSQPQRLQLQYHIFILLDSQPPSARKESIAKTLKFLTGARKFIKKNYHAPLHITSLRGIRQLHEAP